MTTRVNNKNTTMYVGDSRKFQISWWIHPCYMCEVPNGNYFEFCGVQVYACKTCEKIPWSKDGKHRRD